jgi:hypothetical protein
MHDVRNVGLETLRVVGFFAANSLVHRFSEYEAGIAEAVFVHS